jgi:hypothetical protein
MPLDHAVMSFSSFNAFSIKPFLKRFVIKPFLKRLGGKKQWKSVKLLPKAE